MRRSMRHAVLAITLLSASVFVNPVIAAAATFDFANLKSSPTSGFLPDGTAGLDYFACTGGDLCSSNVGAGALGGNLYYQSGGVVVEATGYYNGGTATVVQDHENAYNGLLSGPTAIGAGLGVYHKVNPTDNSDDNITLGETLKLSFDQVVTMATVGLRSEGHNTTSWGTNTSFQYSTDGSTWTTQLFPTGSGLFAINLTSQDFYFRYATIDFNPDQFYVSSVTVTPVPEPEIYAMMGLGLGVMGFMARRRKQQVSGA